MALEEKYKDFCYELQRVFANNCFVFLFFQLSNFKHPYFDLTQTGPFCQIWSHIFMKFTFVMLIMINKLEKWFPLQGERAHSLNF